jgi:hypothetical protein
MEAMTRLLDNDLADMYLAVNDLSDTGETADTARRDPRGRGP